MTGNNYFVQGTDFLRLYTGSAASAYVQFTAANSITTALDTFFTGSESYSGLQYLANKINRHPEVNKYFTMGNISSASNGAHPFTIVVRQPGCQGNDYRISGSTIFAGISGSTGPNFYNGTGSVYQKDGELNSSFYSNRPHTEYSAATHATSIWKYRDAYLMGQVPRFAVAEDSFPFSLLTPWSVSVSGTPVASASLFCESYPTYYCPTASQTYIHHPIVTGKRRT